MHSPKISSSPSYKNLKYKQSQSPIELKEKMRKDYKSKVQNCRDMLLNRFRGTAVADELRGTLTELYKNTFDFIENVSLNEEENELLEEIKQDLIQEELEWFHEEYEKSQMDNIDWSSYQVEDHVICPICQKNNLRLHQGLISCEQCKMEITKNISLGELKKNIFLSMESHSTKCNSDDIQFSLITEGDQCHIYLICDVCLEMQLII